MTQQRPPTVGVSRSVPQKLAGTTQPPPLSGTGNWQYRPPRCGQNGTKRHNVANYGNVMSAVAVCVDCPSALLAYYAAAGHESLKIIIFNHTILLLNALNGLHQLHRGTGVRFDFLKYYYYYYYYYAIVHVVQT